MQKPSLNDEDKKILSQIISMPSYQKLIEIMQHDALTELGEKESIEARGIYQALKRLDGMMKIYLKRNA